MNKTSVLIGKKIHICELWMGINDHLDSCIYGIETLLPVGLNKNPYPHR